MEIHTRQLGFYAKQRCEQKKVFGHVGIEAEILYYIV